VTVVTGQERKNPTTAVLYYFYRPSQVSLVLYNGRINIIVEGSKFKESHILENTKLWNKVGRMPRPLVLFRPSNSGLASFCACFRYPVLGRSCPYASRYRGFELCFLRSRVGHDFRGKGSKCRKERYRIILTTPQRYHACNYRG
jgi:hypothetical protein